MTPLLLQLACHGTKDDTGTWTQDSEPPVEEGCSNDDECLGWQICEQDSCVAGDRNNSLEEAVAIFWDTPIEGILESTGDKDWFTFQAEGGEYVRVDTAWTGGEDGDTSMNTVVSLYDPKGKLHTREDEHALGSVTTYDTILYSYLPSEGTWTLVVEDLDGVGNSTYGYELRLLETGNHTDEGDSSNNPSFSLDMENNRVYAVGVVIDEPGDSDWIELSLPYDECPVVFWGNVYTRETELTPLVELYVPEEEQPILTKVDPGPNGQGLYFEVNGREGLVRVTDAEGGGGAAYWTFLYLRVYDRGYTYTLEEELNDDAEQANLLAVTWGTNDNGNVGSSQAWGVMDWDADVDWFAVDVDDQHYLLVDGTADSLGSLLDAGVEVYSEGGELLGTGEPDEDQFSDVARFGPLDAGRYYIKVFAENDDAVGPGFYYRFTAFQTDYN